MPELPEVEIVRKSLNKKISGKIINDVRVKNRNLRLKIPKNFETNILLLSISFFDTFVYLSTLGGWGFNSPFFEEEWMGAGGQLVPRVLSEGSRPLPHRSLMPEAYLPEVY